LFNNLTAIVMGIFNFGILGPFSGKVGGIVGTTWKGKPVVRSAPKKSSKPPSHLQLMNMKRFQVVERFLNPMSAWIKMSYSIDPPDKTKRNLATSYHKLNALIETGDVVEIDYPKARISMGDLEGIAITAATVTAQNALALWWEANSEADMAQADDALLVVAYAPEIHQYFFSESEAVREDGEVLLPLPATFAGREVHCWAAFRNAHTGKTANSSYVYLT
jgi:hypothetical protein